MSERYVGTNGTVSTPISSQTITSKKLVAETRWLKLSTVTYLDPTGSERVRPSIHHPSDILNFQALNLTYLTTYAKHICSLGT